MKEELTRLIDHYIAQIDRVKHAKPHDPDYWTNIGEVNALEDVVLDLEKLRDSL